MRKTFPTDDLQVDALFTLLGRLALDAKSSARAPDRETDRAFTAEHKTENLDDRGLGQVRPPSPAIQGRKSAEANG
jgi:hypothetical protein